MPKLAYPIENFLGSNTSQFLTNLLAETPDNPSGSYSTPICPRNTSVCPIWIVLASPSPTLALCQPQEALRQLRWPLWCSAQHLVASAWPCVSICWLCVTLFGCCAALPTQSLPSLFLYTQCPSAPLSITDSISLSKARSRE